MHNYIIIYIVDIVGMGPGNHTRQSFPVGQDAAHLVRFRTFQSWSFSIGAGASNKLDGEMTDF